jgi:LmbE family N-acetylglucosaminyl deacetylase
MDVVVIAVTDGEAAYQSNGDDQLAELRRREQVNALMALADNNVETVRLGLPDGRVDLYAQELATNLAMVIEPHDLVIAPWLGDHHADHVAVARATLAAVADIEVDLKFSLFWAWHRSAPDLAAASNLLRLELSDDERRRKSAALDCHRSQTAPPAPLDPVLNPELTEPARWPSEFFVDGSDR